MPPPSRRLNDKSLNQILTASKSSLVTAGEISNINIVERRKESDSICYPLFYIRFNIVTSTRSDMYCTSRKGLKLYFGNL